MNAYKNLAVAIVEQAINDWKQLEEYNINKMRILGERTISKNELSEFFKSQWCKLLLHDLDLIQDDICKYLGVE